METVERDYAPRGVRFFYVYKALAHPEYNNYVTPFTIEERLMHIREAERTIGSRIPWLCDTMSNDLKTLFGGPPNAEFVIDPEGRVARRRIWRDPDALRSDLVELVGPVEKVTQVSDLEMKTAPPPKTAARGVVPGVEPPGPMRALRIEPEVETTKIPFYAKLRAEADQKFLDDRDGTLYLGFHLDPLYRVHWNNETKPLEFELSPPAGVHASPLRASAPQVKEPADADPREFLLDLSAEEDAGPMGLTVRYFACDDDNTFCIPVTQKYRVFLEPDPDGGRTMGRGGGPSGRFADGGDLKTRMMRWDTDGDGLLTAEEVPERMRMRFDRMDTNEDGALDADEIEAAAGRMRGRRP